MKQKSTEETIKRKQPTKRTLENVWPTAEGLQRKKLTKLQGNNTEEEQKTQLNK